MRRERNIEFTPNPEIVKKVTIGNTMITVFQLTEWKGNSGMTFGNFETKEDAEAVANSLMAHSLDRHICEGYKITISRETKILNLEHCITAVANYCKDQPKSRYAKKIADRISEPLQKTKKDGES
tara:strand:- start:625 stop:999 length:375 start_codon:yes stop_codon:yes gene_type:complete